MMGGLDGVMGGWGVFGWLGMLIPLLFWVGLIALVIWAVARIVPNAGSGRLHQGVPTESAEDVLRERFARGQIDAEE
ncbi:hypothetical protein GBA63_18645 [Rubrobacter tropicus]|uniref:SHOCT domain-containing protein n=1 Tax=Rubrobacter tropicus TaxID=2653851 RepID=A0A6G8QD68_9ACTN|nr:hypothetical protein [Rubrobacter tropicus]QIN84436.1 hypothetical protein GBA63_18645 [Rubrobacter tropicus]